MTIVQPVILSHKRAGRVTTHKHVAKCKICIPESQADEYARAHPDLERIVHPDSVIGIWAKREWCRVELGDHVQLDDDSTGIYRVYRAPGSWKKGKLGPDRAHELLQMTADRARKLGAYLFGWGQHLHPLTYNGLRPFRFGGYTPSGALGILSGAKFWWPTKAPVQDGEDYWICLLNAHYHRFSFLDRRFAFAFKGTYADFVRDAASRAGGLSEFRAQEGGVEEVEAAALKFLQQHFGSEVITRKISTGPSLTHGLEQSGRRRIVMPYRV